MLRPWSYPQERARQMEKLVTFHGPMRELRSQGKLLPQKLQR